MLKFILIKNLNYNYKIHLSEYEKRKPALVMYRWIIMVEVLILWYHP